jgi:hypothetical protein
MAKLPGTEMELIEKYPASWRADHPNFGDVVKTTFAKGVISDFKKISDDPIEVESLIKVTGDWGESDYLPILFCPKKLYWDNDDALATDYNEESGFFEKAWMSFRGDDEVAVMLKEGVPVAVLAFADAVPRIGEDIVQFDCDIPFKWQTSETTSIIDFIYENENGPDGLPLKLEKEAELIYDELGPDIIGGWYQLSVTCVAELQTAIEDLTANTPFYIIFSGERKTYTVNKYWSWTNEKVNGNKRCQIHLLTVGPILYLIAAIWNSNYRTEHENGSSTELPCPSWGKVCYWQYFCVFPFAGCMPPDPPAYYNDCDGPDGHITADAEAEVAAMNFTHQTADPADLSQYEKVKAIFRIYAAIYSDKLYEETKNNPPNMDWTTTGLGLGFQLNPDPPAGFTFQWQTTNTLDTVKENIIVEDAIGMAYHIRPHTKEELQDAGMWPES